MSKLSELLQARFGADVPAADAGVLEGMAAHRTMRAYDGRAVPDDLVRTLAAVALSAPSKSDLQQADIVHVRDVDKRAAIAAMVPDNPWVGRAPAFVVFCGNNRRQRRVHELRGHAFVNDHLDAFFNAAVDAGIVLGTFVAAAEAMGLGTCPISQLRNHAAAISDLLELPPYVFPVAGLCLGWPAHPGRISPRLPLRATYHVDQHNDSGLDGDIVEYDSRRNLTRAYGERRRDDLFGAEVPYGWSEDKARQYAQPERQGWGAYVISRGFRLV